MIWLASYPRSGNTFIRNILNDVYGLESSSFFEKKGEPENYTDFPFVKCHLLPEELIPNNKDIKAVYLIRDGRDALVSMAHQRRDIYEPNSNFEDNFREALIAANGSYFGGWSHNVEQWIKRTTIFIRFEDLIKNPLEQCDRLRKIIELPPANKEMLPTFKSLKFGKPKYGRGKRIAKTEEEELDIVKKSFRKGVAGGWKDELSEELHDLFWSYHRDTMERTGYAYDGSTKEPEIDFDYDIMKLQGYKTPKSEKKYKVLIEANKLLMHRNDGVKRYVIELLKALYPVANNPDGRWQIDVFVKGRIHPLSEYGKQLFVPGNTENKHSRFYQLFIFSRSIVMAILPEKIYEYLVTTYKKALMKVGLEFAKAVWLIYKKISVLKGRNKTEDKCPPQTGTIDAGTYDLIHVPLAQHYKPFVDKKNNYLLTLHDFTHLFFKDYHLKKNIKMAENGMDFFLEQNANYIAISKSTKQDFLQEYDTKNCKVDIIYEAADNKKFKPHFNEKLTLFVCSVYNIPDFPFLLTLSTIEPRKNLINTIKAFELLISENPDLDTRLIIAGKKGWKSNEAYKIKNTNRIIFTGFIDESHLPVIYSKALALCYVSHYEGFGLPPLEAMSCGTPVIYGDNSSMTELYSDVGLPADSSDINSIKEQMYKISTDKELKGELSKKSLKRSFDFSWRETASQTLKVYENNIINYSIKDC